MSLTNKKLLYKHSMDRVHPCGIPVHNHEGQDEEGHEDDKVERMSKRWYLLVIALLYLGIEFRRGNKIK